MSKPDDIPQDVWGNAKAAYAGVCDAEPSSTIAITAIARAILAEREQCATIVETKAVSRGYAGGMPRGEALVNRTNPSAAAALLAAAIRKGGE